jgi:hypothetical protein
VDATRIRHVVADQDDAPRPELDSEIERLKPGIAAAADLAGLGRNAVGVFAAVLGNLYGSDVGIFEVRPGPCDFQAVVFRQSLPVFPPCGIAAVDDISPRAEVYVFLDREPRPIPGRFGRPESVDAGSGTWPTCDDDGYRLSPIRPLSACIARWR